MMLGEPRRVDAHLLRELHMFDHVGIDLLGREAAIALGHEVEEAEMHQDLLFDNESYGWHHAMTAPPLAITVSPAMNRLRGEARNATTSAMSSGSAARCTGILGML